MISSTGPGDPISRAIGCGTFSSNRDLDTLLARDVDVPGLSSSPIFWVTVLLLWLDVGLELGLGEPSRLILLGLDSTRGVIPPIGYREPP